MGPVGKVFLVGAGPGDPDLMTIKAVKVLQSAEVVVYDRLVSGAVLDMVPKGVTRICVGKKPHHHPIPQEEINETLVRLAEAGRMVVRLKGGDPFIFGRGGEEILTLKAAGIAFEVVAGITSAQACAAKLCIPLTHRGIAHSIRYVTGHCQSDQELNLDWEGLADPDTTVVIYMGLANIDVIASKLISHGRSAKTPVLAVSQGTLPGECHFVTTLDDVTDDVRAASLSAPAVFVVGEVVRLAEVLGTSSHAQHLDSVAAAE